MGKTAVAPPGFVYAALRSDRHVRPSVSLWRFCTEAEVRALRPGAEVQAMGCDGRVGYLRITSMRTWKRDPTRVEVRWKYGMYEYGASTLREAMQTLVRAA